MKLSVAIAVLFFAYLSFAQEKPFLIDEFGIVTCEDLLARTSGFGTRLTEVPDASGAVTISYTPENKARVERDRRLVYHSLRRTDIDTDRLQFYRSTEAEKIKVSVWIIPPGAAKPPGAGELWNYERNFDLTKPFLFDIEDETGVCPTFVPRDFADLINKNPSIIGRVIVHQESNWSPAVLGLPWIEMFTKKYGVPRKRLRLTYGKRSKSIGYTEFWIVPARK